MHHEKNENSVLENVGIQPLGFNPFRNSNVWWYIIGICLFGVLGSYADQTFIQIFKSKFSWEFYTGNFSNLLRFLILPILFSIVSKIMFLIFIYKKWGFIANSNTEAPYSSNVVWRNYIAPIIYFIIASFFLGLLSLGFSSRESAYGFLIIRGLLLLGLLIYLTVWNYRLLVLYPRYFNTVPISMKNRSLTLPLKMGAFLWILPIVSSVFQYISIYINNGNFYSSADKKWEFHLSEYLYLTSRYAIDFYYLILAIYIFVIIKTSKLFFNEIEENE